MEKLIRLSKEEVELLTFEKVHEMYKGLMVNLVNKWSFKYEFDDLFQMASWGLWDAYKYHDPDNGYTFGTLAQKTIINYIRWYRQNNNRDKIKRETSAISDICSYDAHVGYIEALSDKSNFSTEVEDRILIQELFEKIKKENVWLRAHEKKASDRNVEFLKLIANGKTQREIAEMYNLNISTVQRGLYKEYKRIKQYLRVNSFDELIAM